MTGWIGADERAAFDRHFRAHPLMRYHAGERGPFAHRISDSVAPARFRESALFNDHYRRIGLDHAVVLPIRVDDGQLVSFVLHRRGRAFSDREVALLDELRRPLAELFGRMRTPIAVHLKRPDRAGSAFGLTPREAECWAGSVPARPTVRSPACWAPARARCKSTCSASMSSSMSETRTAAVMRAFAHH